MWSLNNCYRLTHWGQVTHICVGNLTIIGLDNGLSPGRRQAIIWTNAGILWIGPWRTNFTEILIGIHTFSFKKTHFKMSFGKWQPSCLGLNVLRFMSTSCEITLRWIPQNTFDEKSALAQVMAWCHQATSYYLSQCWPRYIIIQHHQQES